MPLDQSFRVVKVPGGAGQHEANRPDAADVGPVAHRRQAWKHLHGHVLPTIAHRDDGPPLVNY